MVTTGAASTENTGTIHNKTSQSDPSSPHQRPVDEQQNANETDNALSLHQDEKPCGSLELGKHRNDDDPVRTEPEKHLSARAPSKEFYFPKSN